MSKIIISKFVVGLVLFGVGGFFLFTVDNKSDVAKASSGTVIKSYWEATQLLTIDTNGVLWRELGKSKRYFAIGPGEWKVVMKEVQGADEVDVYEETWSLPSMPNCYQNPSSNCGPTTGAENFLWSLGWETGRDTTPRSWTFTLKPPGDAELFKVNNDRAFGQGSIGGADETNIHAIVTNGSYGWMHARFDEADAGGVVTAGSMIPLKWVVTGTFLP